MHSVVMMSALAITSGLFGSGRSYCTSGQCSGASLNQVQSYQYVPATYYQPTLVYPTAYQQPVVSTPALPAITATTPAIPAAASAPPTAASTSPAPTTPLFYYYYYPTATTCPNGRCYRR